MTDHVIRQTPPPPTTGGPGFARWDADDALDALYRAGLDIDEVEQARWEPGAPQPRTQRQAFIFRSPGVVDPHLLLIFDTPEALEAWRLWLARYWKARPYLSIRDNVLLLVSREVPETEVGRFHDALARLGAVPEPPLTAPPPPAEGQPGSEWAAASDYAAPRPPGDPRHSGGRPASGGATPPEPGAP